MNNKIKRVGVVLHPYNESNQSGLGRYALELTKEIINNDKNNKYIIFLKNIPNKDLRFESDNWEIKIINKKILWLDRGLWKEKLDVCLFLTPVMPFFVKFKKSILVVPDLSYLHAKPKKLKEKIKKVIIFMVHRFSLKSVDKVVSISNATKKDILKYFNISFEKIKVIYLGNNNLNLLKEDFVETPNNFFLYVGVVKPRKNVLNLVKSFNEFKKQDKKGFKLIIVGSYGGDYYKEISDFISRENITDEVLFKGYLTDEKIVYLYKKAYIFVYPSLIEGFGMTILEAQSFGLPVLISNINVFKEIFIRGGLFFNELDVDDMRAKFLEITQDENLYQKLSKGSIINAGRFSWRKTALGFLELINE